MALDEPTLDEIETDHETIETEGLSHAVDSKEEKEQQEENRRLMQEWRDSMAAAATNFLSDPSVVSTHKYRKKRFALTKSEIDRRVRRNAGVYSAFD